MMLKLNQAVLLGDQPVIRPQPEVKANLGFGSKILMESSLFRDLDLIFSFVLILYYILYYLESHQ